MERTQQDTGDGQQETGSREYRLRAGDDIAERIPADPAGRHLGLQLLRCATSPGANYEEARAAESRADFVHKISIAAKEMRESRYWIALLNRSGWLRHDLAPLIDEAEQLAAILGASARTARRRAASAGR